MRHSRNSLGSDKILQNRFTLIRLLDDLRPIRKAQDPRRQSRPEACPIVIRPGSVGTKQLGRPLPPITVKTTVKPAVCGVS